MNVQSFAAEWIAAWNARDLERILSHYAPEIELVSPLAARLVPESGGTIRGFEALRSYWTRGLAQSPDLHFELVSALESVSGCTPRLPQPPAPARLRDALLRRDGEGDPRERVVLDPSAGSRR